MTNPLLDPNARLVIGHRGNRARSPENTLVSLRDAVELGVDAIEFDIRITRDGVPVLMHDALLDRTTTGRGLLSHQTLADIESLHVGTPAPGGERVPIPTLEQVLDVLREVPMVIEVKELAAAERTERMIQRFGLEGSVVVGSAESDVCAYFYRSGLSTCASPRDAVSLIPAALLGRRLSRPAYSVLSISPSYRGAPIPVARMARAARHAGVATQVWTVNDPNRAQRYWAGGVAGIVTDDPAAMIRTRSR